MYVCMLLCVGLSEIGQDTKFMLSWTEVALLCQCCCPRRWYICRSRPNLAKVGTFSFCGTRQVYLKVISPYNGCE